MMAAAVVGVSLLVLFAVSLRSPRTGLLVVMFLVPWNGFDVDIGLRVSAYQIAVAALLFATLLRAMRPGWRPPPLPAGRLLGVLILLAVVWSLIQIAFIPELEIAKGALRAPIARAVIQIGLFVFLISPTLLTGWLMRTEGDIRALYRTYLISMVVLAAIGWAQLIVWYATGSNPIPIGIINDWLGGDAEARTAHFDFAALAIYRMNSFCGEPRQLGGALVLAMVSLQCVMLNARRVDWRRLAPLWGFFLITAIPTYSTSAVAIWLIGTATQLILPRLFGIRIQRSAGQLLAAVLIVVVPLSLAVAGAEAGGIPVLDLLADRTIDRIEDNGAVEDFDLAILDFLHDHPESAVLGTGLGNAHLYAGRYIQPEFLWYAEGVVFTAKEEYLRLISEVGVVGLTLFLAWYTVLVIGAARALRRAGSALIPLVPQALVVLVVFLASATVGGEFWAVAGALTVAGRLRAPVGDEASPRRVAVALSRYRSRRLAQKLGRLGLTPG